MEDWTRQVGFDRHCREKTRKGKTYLVFAYQFDFAIPAKWRRGFLEEENEFIRGTFLYCEATRTGYGHLVQNGPFILNALMPQIHIELKQSAVHRDRGYTQDIIGADSLVGKRVYKIQGCSIPYHLRIAVSLQQVTAFPQLKQNFIQHLLQRFIFVDIDVVFGFAAHRIEVHLVFRHISSQPALHWVF